MLDVFPDAGPGVVEGVLVHGQVGGDGVLLTRADVEFRNLQARDGAQSPIRGQ